MCVSRVCNFHCSSMVTVTELFEVQVESCTCCQFVNEPKLQDTFATHVYISLPNNTLETTINIFLDVCFTNLYHDIIIYEHTHMKYIFIHCS